MLLFLLQRIDLMSSILRSFDQDGLIELCMLDLLIVESRAAILRIEFKKISVAEDVDADELAAQVRKVICTTHNRLMDVLGRTFLRYVEMLVFRLCMRIWMRQK